MLARIPLTRVDRKLSGSSHPWQPYILSRLSRLARLSCTRHPAGRRTYHSRDASRPESGPMTIKRNYQSQINVVIEMWSFCHKAHGPAHNELRCSGIKCQQQQYRMVFAVYRQFKGTTTWLKDSSALLCVCPRNLHMAWTHEWCTPWLPVRIAPMPLKSAVVARPAPPQRSACKISFT